MAYINKDQKKIISDALKKVIPSTIKWSLSIQDHSTIHLNIKSMPASMMFSPDVEEVIARNGNFTTTAASYNHKCMMNDVELYEKIVAAMNIGNYDNSDAQRDYFSVGFYTRINFGRWDKPLVRN